MNLLGVKTGRHYPKDAFWRIVAREGNCVILGCDAHAPKDVADAQVFARGYEYAKSFGIVPADRLNINRLK